MNSSGVRIIGPLDLIAVGAPPATPAFPDKAPRPVVGLVAFQSSPWPMIPDTALRLLAAGRYNHPARAEELLNATETLAAKWGLAERVFG